MSGSHRSSKGKARAKDADLEQSLSSLSLSDYDHHAPRADHYDLSYTDTYGSSYDPTYTGDNQNYVLAAQGSYAPTQWSPATYGSTEASSQYPATSATSSTGVYEYQSEVSGSPAYSSYSAHDAASVTSSSAPSCVSGGTESVWSETESHATGASSAPSGTSHHTDVNNTINRQAAPNQVYELPCELSNLTGCNVVFPGDDEEGWIDHVERHLGDKLPSKLRCWFCHDYYFDAKQTSNGDSRYNFRSRMQHIRYHIVYEGFRPEHMMKDGHVVQHLFNNRLIDSRTYVNILKPSTVPPIPGDQGNQGDQSRQGHQSHHRSHRSHHSHQSHLPRVVEENVAGEGSSRSRRSSDRRSDHKKKGHERSQGSSYRRDH